MTAALATAAALFAAFAAWWTVNIAVPTVRYWRSRRKESP